MLEYTKILSFNRDYHGDRDWCAIRVFTYQASSLLCSLLCETLLPLAFSRRVAAEQLPVRMVNINGVALFAQLFAQKHVSFQC